MGKRIRVSGGWKLRLPGVPPPPWPCRQAMTIEGNFEAIASVVTPLMTASWSRKKVAEPLGVSRVTVWSMTKDSAFIRSRYYRGRDDIHGEVATVAHARRTPEPRLRCRSPEQGVTGSETADGTGEARVGLRPSALNSNATLAVSILALEGAATPLLVRAPLAVVRPSALPQHRRPAAHRHRKQYQQKEISRAWKFAALSGESRCLPGLVA